MRADARPVRRGFTLPEMMIVLLIFALTLGSLMTLVMRQQRFYRSAGDVMSMRGQLRQGLGAVAADLRAISPANGDVYDMTDKAIELRALTGSSIVCKITNASRTITVPPTTLSSGNMLTAWPSMPAATDSFFVYDDSTGTATARWKAYSISSIAAVSGSSGCTTASGFVQASDTTRSSYAITIPVGQTLPPTLLTGAPIRFFRRVRYELYQASDSKFYLGYYDCLAGRAPVCNALQPIAGPFRNYSTNAANSGLLFAYYDSTGSALGAAIGNAPRVTRVTVSLRGQSAATISMDGTTPDLVNDSLVMDVALRNRR